VIGRGVAGIKGDEFIYQTLVKYDTDGYWKKLAAGSTFESINSDAVKGAVISVPQDIDEQKKIGDYFCNLDNLITLHQRKLDTYKKMKQGVMQKLFNQKVRFKKDDGTDYEDWTYKLLGDCCTIKTGKLDANAAVENGKYKFFTCAREDSLINDYAFEGVVIVIAGNGDIGHTKLYNGQFNAYQRTYVLQNFTDNVRYLQAAIDTYLPRQIHIEAQGSTMPYIKLTTLTDLYIPVPSDIEEQKKIADCLSKYDELISASKQKLESYKKLKKAMLQKMFC
jgi:type I restriction enzyme S subunit